MQFSRALFIALAAPLVACSSDPVSREVTPEASAAIRWVNAIADTVPMDYRVVTYPSNASEPGLAFQGSSGRWRIIPAGTHDVKAFFANTTAAGTDVSIVSQVIDQASFNLEANKKYTILHYGFAKTGASPQRRLTLIEDVTPTVPAGQIAIRVINAAPALGTVNVYANLGTAASGAVPGTPAFTNVAPGAVTAWVNFPVAAAPQTYRVSATAPGSTTALVDMLAPVGAPAVAQGANQAPLDAVAGSQQATSAFTIVVFGPRVSYILRTPTGGTSTVAATTAGAAATLLDVWPAKISP
ncbi:MAG: DUF4397 domain-containing protein [Gemmatimonadaceae bacterium]